MAHGHAACCQPPATGSRRNDSSQTGMFDAGNAVPCREDHYRNESVCCQSGMRIYQQGVRHNRMRKPALGCAAARQMDIKCVSYESRVRVCQ